MTAYLNLRSALDEGGWFGEAADKLIAAHRDLVRTEDANRIAAALAHSEAAFTTSVRNSGLRAAERAIRPATAGEQSIYRAGSPAGFALGTYATPALARAHCEHAIRRDHPDGTDLLVTWRPVDEAQLDSPHHAWESGHDTGFAVTGITVASSFDPEGDE
jgi:hypothetical protein